MGPVWSWGPWFDVGAGLAEWLEKAPKMSVDAWLLPAVSGWEFGWSGMKGCVGKMEWCGVGPCGDGVGVSVGVGVGA